MKILRANCSVPENGPEIFDNSTYEESFGVKELFNCVLDTDHNPLISSPDERDGFDWPGQLLAPSTPFCPDVNLAKIIAERVALYTDLSRRHSNHLAEIVRDELRESQQSRRQLETLVDSKLHILRVETDIAIAKLRRKMTIIDSLRVTSTEVTSAIEEIHLRHRTINEALSSVDNRVTSAEIENEHYNLRLNRLEERITEVETRCDSLIARQFQDNYVHSLSHRIETLAEAWRHHQTIFLDANACFKARLDDALGEIEALKVVVTEGLVYQQRP